MPVGGTIVTWLGLLLPARVGSLACGPPTKPLKRNPPSFLGLGSPHVLSGGLRLRFRFPLSLLSKDHPAALHRSDRRRFLTERPEGVPQGCRVARGEALVLVASAKIAVALAKEIALALTGAYRRRRLCHDDWCSRSRPSFGLVRGVVCLVTETGDKKLPVRATTFQTVSKPL